MLTKTNIEYGEMNWNIYRGCLNKPQGYCPVPNCWSEAMSKRQGWDFHKPELLAKNLLDPLRRKKPTRILVNFSGDLFGEWVDQHQITHPEYANPHDERIPNAYSQWARNWSFDILVRQVVTDCPQHTFLFLTKRPENIWPIEWPDNCWLGATVCNQEMLFAAYDALSRVKAKHKWISVEPLFESLGYCANGDDHLQDIKGLVDWVVIGAQTNPTIVPKPEWVDEIIMACNQAGVKVWVKNNLVAHLPQFAGNLVM